MANNELTVVLRVEHFSDETLLFELCDRHREHTHDAPKKIDYYKKHKVITLPIGDDYTADLIISDEAYRALLGSPEGEK